jgi:alpha-tubulin suppressor-like RCC1 family protein
MFMPLVARAVFALVLLYATSASAGGLLDHVRQVSAGITHTCALLDDGTVACWGSNSWGELGDGSTAPHARPAHVTDAATRTPMSGFTQIVTGSTATCGLRGGDVYCWGSMDSGTSQPHPARVSVGAPVMAIAAKAEFACALLDTPQRSVRCWGRNVDGQLGDGSRTSRAAPADVVITERDGSHSLLAGVKQIAAGSDHACAVLDDTSVACWGFNWAGELGNASFADSTSPVAVVAEHLSFPKLFNVESVAVNGLHSCAKFASTWLMACWGNNSQGQLGDPAVRTDIATPVDIALGVATIDAGEESTCAMLADHRLACWGGNGYGQLGNGSTTRAYTPTLVTSLPKIASLSVGTYHACAVLPDTTVRCWGRGDTGQLGDGGTTPFSANPVPVAALSF